MSMHNNFQDYQHRKVLCFDFQNKKNSDKGLDNNIFAKALH